jgi:hypothetical protein
MKKIKLRYVGYALIIVLFLILSSDIQITTPVNIEKSSFNPSNTNIEATDTIIWINNDTKTHHIVSDGSFDLEH